MDESSDRHSALTRFPVSCRVVQQRFNTSCFARQPQFTFGNAPRNSVLAPGYASVDVGIQTDTTLGNGTRLQFRWEIFNLLNRTSFDVTESHRVHAELRTDLQCDTAASDAGRYQGAVLNTLLPRCSGATSRAVTSSAACGPSPRCRDAIPLQSRGQATSLLTVQAPAYNACMQYTIRGVPASVDRALRARSRADRTSLNEAAVAALVESTGGAGARKRRDLGDIAGTWRTDKALESALAAQDEVDQELWR